MKIDGLGSGLIWLVLSHPFAWPCDDTLMLKVKQILMKYRTMPDKSSFSHKIYMSHCKMSTIIKATIYVMRTREKR